MLSESVNMDQALTDHEIFKGDRPHDHCGIFGMWAPGKDVSRLTYFSLYALQHHGQQSTGIVTSNGKQIPVYKDQGLVDRVFTKQTLQGLQRHLVLGHMRYATTGEDARRNARPTLGPTPSDTLVLCHSGNLTNTVEFRDLTRSVTDEGESVERNASTDISAVTALLSLAERIPGPVPFIPPVVALAGPVKEGDASSAIPGEQLVSVNVDAEPAALVVPTLKVLPRLKSTFSLVFVDEDTLYEARGLRGCRPLVLGCPHSGWVLASETAALDLCGASFVHEIEPGELVAINSVGIHSRHFTVRRSNTCAFEYVYLTRSDTVIGNHQIVAARREMGAIFAQKSPVDTDLVIPIPESDTPAAIGYTGASGIPFAQGLAKNAYVGRTFIQPTQSLRQLGIRPKLNPLREVIAGKRLVVIDDSIVRGNTQRTLVRVLCEAGVVEVRMKISSPPVAWPCFFGIDSPTRTELIASSIDMGRVRASIGADSLSYLSMEEVVRTTRQGSSLCLDCFNDAYPEQIPEGTPIPGTSGTFAC